MAIRINRVYTRTGDDGKTALVGGKRVPKDDPRISAYGEVDELNAVVGMVRAILGEPPYKGRVASGRLDTELAVVQQELFDLGSELATPPGATYQGMITAGKKHTDRLEAGMDALQKDLAPLRSFVLPGGGTAGATLHLARTVCRRAERTVTALVRKKADGPWTARYLNRLSDLLFVQSRWIAKKSRKKETLWQHGLEPSPKKRSKRKATRTKK